MNLTFYSNFAPLISITVQTAMIVSACMDFTQRIGGGCGGLYPFVKDCTGYWAIPQADRAVIEKLPDPSNKERLKFFYDLLHYRPCFSHDKVVADISCQRGFSRIDFYYFCAWLFWNNGHKGCRLYYRWSTDYQHDITLGSNLLRTQEVIWRNHLSEKNTFRP